MLPSVLNLVSSFQIRYSYDQRMPSQPNPLRHRPRQGKAIEPTFYPALLDVIRDKGGSGVQTIQYNSVPDITFELLGGPWILSVKLGESLSVIKGAFIQYLRHKEESGIPRGLLLILPDTLRQTRPQEDALRTAILTSAVTVLVDAGPVKTEYRDVPFPVVLDRLITEICPLLERRVERGYPLRFVVDLLREQVVEMMQGLSLREKDILTLVTDWSLLTEIADLEQQQAQDAARFLAAYVFLSQVIFLRLFSSVHPNVVDVRGEMTRTRLRKSFEKVLEINYRPIFEPDVIDAIPEQFLRDTFALIWGMQIEQIRYELPGRLFHELMPQHIRKLLAAFYTRPQAAELLARLTIDEWDATTLDPACGSGTILTSAYRQKKRLHDQARISINPHRLYCEQDIFGGDIMPFAVHLTCANLAAMDVAETIERTQILQGDSLDIVPGKLYKGGVHQLGLFPGKTKGRKTSGEEYEVVLPESGVDTVLMNPPFTKTERGIADYVDMEKFKDKAGGEVGLWGHFVFLADLFLRPGGTYGAVLPMNVLRGRESEHVRSFVFTEWTPLYIVKSTRSYAFSENAEYRDVLLIAKKERPAPNHRVKVCFVKTSLATLTDEDLENLSDKIKTMDHLRSAELDIDSHPLKAMMPRSANMMWFCGSENLSHRDVLVDFAEKSSQSCTDFPSNYFREGYRPVPKGVSHLLFLTRANHPGRVEESFLRFHRETKSEVDAFTALGASWSIEKTALLPSLRTSVGLARMDITGLHDYIAQHPYRSLKTVKRAAGYQLDNLNDEFWIRLKAELAATSTRIVIARRLDYGSPSFHLTAWYSKDELSPSNQVSVVREQDECTAQAVCALSNSAVFWAQFFLLKEASHARYADIRFYDLYEMHLFPPPELRKPLAKVFKKYSRIDFPSYRLQLDKDFDDRYTQFWESQREGPQQTFLWDTLNRPVSPSRYRLEFDREICEVLEVPVTKDQLRALYRVMVNEIIITRRLAKD
jgi:hypothetical protein